MTDDKKLWNSLAAFLSGNFNEEDRLLVQNWVDESPANRAALGELQAIWQSTRLKLQYPEIQSNELLQELRYRISRKNTPVRKMISFAKAYTVHLMVAAVLGLLAVSYIVITRPAAQEKNTIVKTTNEVTTFYLPDSTRVWLNVNSQIEYATDFTNRKIELTGEAFLSVREDSSDFTVLTLHTETNVLGTSFNIKEQGDSIVTITVAKGKVQFKGRKASENDSVLVEASYKAVLNASGGVKASKNDDPDFAKWREQNNPIFYREKSTPGAFILNTYSWRKNTINQTVIEGTIKNNASLAAYSQIVVELTYHKTNGDTTTVNFPIEETVLPGKAITYRKRLLDILTSRQKVTARIKAANATSKNVY